MVYVWSKLCKVARGSYSITGLASWLLWCVGIYVSMRYLHGANMLAGVTATKAVSWSVYAFAIVRA